MNLLKTIGGGALQVLKTVAPTIATAAAGPFGPLVGPIVAKIFGVSSDDPKAAETALLNATPDQLLALKKAEQDFQVQMKQLGITEQQLAYQDTANAREREIKTGDSWTPRVIAVVFISGWFGIQWFLLQHVVPQEMREIIMRTLGTLDMALGLILGYYFGSSASSHSKDSTLAEIAKK